MKYIAAVWIHVGFVYQLLRKTGLFFVLLLLASVARAQEEKPLPMPQVTSKTTGKCVVVTHGANARQENRLVPGTLYVPR